MVTIGDVAKKAGVSVATVSRVLNRKGKVRPETAQRVFEAVKQLNYQPNLMARNLRRSETRVLLILTPNMTNPYYARILMGIGDTATNLGYSAFICNTADKHENEVKALNMLEQRRADGAILLASALGCERLLPYAERFPLLQCSEFDPEVDISHISIDNYVAAKDVVNYLVELGHKDIAHMSSENNYLSTRLRKEGYQDRLKAQGLPVREEYIAYASRDYSFRSGKIAARKLLSLNPRPTAVFCISDTLALATIMVAQEMGLSVPQDLTVIGFDDVEETQMFHPYLTTVAQPCYDLGCRSAIILTELIHDSQKGSVQEILPHEIVLRESSARAPKKRD